MPTPAHAAPVVRLSRSRVELFLECPRCFWLATRGETARPDGPPLRLHLTIDAILKKEFDVYRLRGEPHPTMRLFGIEAVPFRHVEMETWRDFRQGIAVAHAASGIELYGAVDDIWQHADGRLSVVDYKTTSTRPPVAFTGPHHAAYRRQLELYRWLLQGHGFPLHEEDYWLVANADPDLEALDGRLPLALSVVPYRGSTDWVPDALKGMRECLDSETVPTPAKDCRWCRYRREAAEAEDVAR